jgi:hypothetical protein
MPEKSEKYKNGTFDLQASRRGRLREFDPLGWGNGSL